MTASAAALTRRSLVGERTGTDVVVLVADRVLTMNRKPMMNRGKVIGSVTTLRDRTELDTLRRELGVIRTATDTLRAQTHEFANQLHVISGLVQLQEYDDVVRFIDNVTRGRAQLNEEVTNRVLDPALAALLVAKASLASERGVTLHFAEGAALGRIDDELSVDLTTVVGNLVDNALDAVGGASSADPSAQGWVEVDLREEDQEIVVVVRDSGTGVAEDIADQVFQQGFSTLVTRVLVVDDDFMVARVHRGFVEAVSGFEVVEVAHTGEAALVAVRTLHPDLVLLDIHLPDINGLDLLPMLREAHPDLDAIVISAAREAETVRKALRGGIVHYLSSRAARLPKKLSPETADLIEQALRDAGTDLSATECAKVVGLARVSVRRYLEHFVSLGHAEVRLRYGGVGRPERRYVWRA